MGLSMKEKRPIIREFAVRYRAARTKAEKSGILTEFTTVSGFNRKYAIGILGSEGKTKLLRMDGKLVKARITHKTGTKRVYQKRYGPDVAACVIRLWDFFKGMCGRRLVPLVRANIATLAADSRFHITPEIRRELAQISRSTVERMLKGGTEETAAYGKVHDQTRFTFEKPDSGKSFLALG
jgi:hypothetical protein